MATQLWNQEIGKTVDWGGDTSTGGAPVSGQYVQKFIKDTLAKKFGYLYYDKTSQKYFVFADEDDFNTWKSDSLTNANLLLATFDAPAPATIYVSAKSSQNVTILSSDKNQQIVLNYYILDSSENPMNEEINVRALFSNGGNSQVYTTTFQPDYDGYNVKDENGWVGTTKILNIDEYLSTGTNNITVTLTGGTTQAQTSISFKYTVVKMELSSDFDNSNAFEYDQTLDPDYVYDITIGNVIKIPYKCSGQGSKYIEIYVNGQEVHQPADAKNAVSFGDMISSSQDFTSILYLFMTDKNGNLINNLVNGKNSLQFRIYVTDADNNKIYSHTLYYDFVIKEKSNTDDIVYILYRQTLNNKDQYFTSEDIVEFTTQQYSSTSFEYSIYSSTGKEVQLDFDLNKLKTNEDGEIEYDSDNNAIVDSNVASLIRSLTSGKIDTFEYSFLTYGFIEITITAVNPADAKNPYDKMKILVTVNKADVQIYVSSDGLIFNLEALNRSNSEPAEMRNQWIDENNPSIKPVMKNVYFNESSGWDGKSLVLNNGATLEIPYALFGNLDKDKNAQSTLDANGLTVEMTVEMINVQDEDTKMVSFESDNNKSNLVLTASTATITDGGEGQVYTSFNSNTKLKMAFIIKPYKSDWKGDSTGKETNNATFICINGILDKADKRSKEQMAWQNIANPTIVIGDPTGKAGIKIYSLRVYNKALSLDEELTNWIAESDDLLKNYERNTLTSDDWTGSPSLDIMKKKIPTLVIYGDIDKFNNLENKKHNLQMDLEFYDPTDSNRDFYARGCWVSPQGTSSMNYPIKNIRPYFSKIRETKADGTTTTQDNTAEFNTEVYFQGEFTHGEVSDESKLGHFYTNKKATSVKTLTDQNYEYYLHKCYGRAEAKRLQDAGEQLFYKDKRGSFWPCTLGVDDEESTTWYVSGYREVKGYSEIDTTWKMVCDLRYSGQTMYKESGYIDIANPNADGDTEPYRVKTFKKVKGSEKLDKSKTYYIIQSVWKQYDKSGYTDRWTLKADYAESSMCNNAGTGRLWGDVMKGFRIGQDYLGMTEAQKVTEGKIDIRTSCDGKPIVAFCCKLKKDDSGNAIVNENGVRQYESTPEYIGLYNIMTDKSSTKLFGFEDIYSEDGADKEGKPLYDASKTECWECLSNAVQFAQGLNVYADENDQKQENPYMGNRKPIWNAYEARWPDCKDETGNQVGHTHNLESLWRFINFCKDAVDYRIGGVDGYDLSPYVKIKDEDELNELWNSSNRPSFATGEEKSGNMKYELVSDENNNFEWLKNNILTLYYLNENIDYNNITKTVSDTKISDPIYIGKVPSYDAQRGVFLEDIQFDKERVENKDNNIEYGSKIADSPCVEDYYITVYLTRNGSKFEYYDNYGKKQTYSGQPEDYERNSKGETWVGKTKMQYFSEKKYEWFNVYRMAAYYIYLMRFAAVDQVVKNSMLTTEDGQHYYYINYDNDTILGVRNDGNLVYHWNITRNTFDYQVNDFAFAGPKSVLWNLLENDDDFMSIVKSVDNAMFTSQVLSTSIALDMYNNKQEGTWGERLYNINEEIKYLSQYNGNDPLYLKFIHGSSNQYRSWFITNRFNLYDSLWESGDYLTTKIGFRLNVSGADGKRPMFNITAARENKFFLSNVDGAYKDVDDWKIQLGQGETAGWPAIADFKGSSSPWSLYGSDKIKVLDFRPTIGTFELQQLSFIDGYDWPSSKGCLMTGFLIGNSDEYRESEMYKYTNESENPSTLTRTTLTPSKSFTSTTKLVDVPENVVETEVNGSYVYSTTEESVELEVKIASKDSIVLSSRVSSSSDFTSETLAPTVCAIQGIGGMNNISSLEEIDIRNCFNTASLLNDTIEIDKLSNLHIFRAIGSSITTFVPAIGCNFYEISLPKNRMTSIKFDNSTFTPTYDEEGNLIPMLKYTPDSQLKNLVIKNVTMADPENPAFDIVEFISTWIDAYKDQYGASASLKNLTLTLEGVDITATVDWLRQLKELNLQSFTGDVFVIGTGNDESMTQEEFDDLTNLYSVERPFEIGSSLRFSSSDAVFWTVEGGNKVTLSEAENWGTDQNVTEYYEIIHGETLKFRSTKFEKSSINTYQNYTFKCVYNNGWISADLKQDASISLDKCIQNNSFDMCLEVKQNGSSEFISRISGNSNRNEERLVKIYTANNKQAEESNNFIYVKIKQVVEPSDIVLFVNDPENEGEFIKVEKKNGNFNIDLYNHQETRRFLIRYANNYDSDGNESISVTVDSSKPTVSLGKLEDNIVESNKYGTLSDIIANVENLKQGGEFKFTPNIQPANETIDISITAKYTSTLGGTNITANLKVNLKTVMPTKIEIENPYEGDSNYNITFDYSHKEIAEFKDSSIVGGNSISAVVGLKLSINSVIPSSGLRFPLKPYKVEGDGRNYNVNVPIYIIDENQRFAGNYNTSVVNAPTFEKGNDGLWYLVITPNRNADGSKSYDAEYNIYFTGKFGYNNDCWKSEDLQSFSYAYRLDASIILPNTMKVVYDDSNIDITTKTLVISASDESSKTFKLRVVPYDKTQNDPITIPVSVNPSVNFAFSVEYVEPTTWLAQHFAECSTSEENGILYINVTLNKSRNSENSSSNDEIVSGSGSFTLSATFTDLKGNTKSLNDVKIEFNIAQSISSFNKIDDCAPYNIKIDNKDVNCPWYFVDVNNQYYMFKTAILDELIKKDKLNELVGIAKRMQYGFAETKNEKGQWLNYENEGNPYNNASEVWENDPELCSKTNNVFSRNIYTYYRPLCIPLENWHLDDTILGINNPDNDNSNMWKNANNKYNKLNETYGSWAVARYPLIEYNTSIGPSSNFTSLINKIVLNDELTTDCQAIWHKIALHIPYAKPEYSTGIYNKSSWDGIINLMVTRYTDDYSPVRNDSTNPIEIPNISNWSLRLFSAFDIREATKSFCTATVPSWFNGPNTFSNYYTSLDDETSIYKLVYPGYAISDKVNSFRVSGLIDIWHHFTLYGNDTNKSLRCYPASLYELDILFNGKGKEHTSGNLSSNTSYQIDMYTATDGEKTINVPAGIAEICSFLSDTGCLEKLNGKGITTFIEKLYKYFEDDKIGSDVFGSFYLLCKQGNNGDYLNVIGKKDFSTEQNNSDKRLAVMTIAGNVENVPGREKALLMIPLLYVD